MKSADYLNLLNDQVVQSVGFSMMAWHGSYGSIKNHFPTNLVTTMYAIIKAKKVKMLVCNIFYSFFGQGMYIQISQPTLYYIFSIFSSLYLCPWCIILYIVY